MAYNQIIQEDSPGIQIVESPKRERRMKKYDNVIGIDPDIDKSGVGFLEPATRKIECSALSFSNLMAYFDFAKRQQVQSGKTLLVVVEASWMISGNWHLKFGARKEYAAATGYKVGQNHEVGKLICEMARSKGLEVLEHVPLKKCWRGKDGKITQDEIAYFTGISGRTNQEMRDALLLAWSYAGLPIRVKCG